MVDRFSSRWSADAVRLLAAGAAAAIVAATASAREGVDVGPPSRFAQAVPAEQIERAASGQYRLWVLFGDFASREDAAAAARRLPPRYQEAFRVAPRSFGELRRQL